jgi:hypothetical protein
VTDEKPQPEEVNKWDGTYHYDEPTGTRHFGDGDGVVGGVNNHI